jgi:hypothetical protein
VALDAEEVIGVAGLAGGVRDELRDDEAERARGDVGARVAGHDDDHVGAHRDRLARESERSSPPASSLHASSVALAEQSSSTHTIVSMPIVVAVSAVVTERYAFDCVV